MKNKKATIAIEKSLHYVVAGLLISVILGIFVFLAQTQFQATIPRGVEQFILRERFLSSLDCFNYQESEFIPYPTPHLAWDTFHQGRLTNCYATQEKETPQFRLQLIERETNEEKEPVSTAFWPQGTEGRTTYEVSIVKEDAVVRGKLLIDT